jgi:hypothetical protein
MRSIIKESCLRSLRRTTKTLMKRPDRKYMLVVLRMADRSAYTPRLFYETPPMRSEAKAGGMNSLTRLA